MCICQLALLYLYRTDQVAKITQPRQQPTQFWRDLFLVANYVLNSGRGGFHVTVSVSVIIVNFNFNDLWSRPLMACGQLTHWVISQIQP